MAHFLEEIWDDILSRRPALIRRRFSKLDNASQNEVMTHLKRMVSEDGWQEVQIKSAQAALEVLENPESGNDG